MGYNKMKVKIMKLDSNKDKNNNDGIYATVPG